MFKPDLFKAGMLEWLNKPLAWLIILGTLAHGLLLLNDGVYWDGWELYLAHIADRWEIVHWIFTERGGIPIYTGLLWLLNQSPAFIFSYKLVSFVSLLGAAVCIFHIARYFGLSDFQAFFIALLGLVYPSNQAIVELIITPYLFSYGFFWLGWLLIIKAEGQTARKQKLGRLIATLCLILGFRLYSMLFFHFAVFFLYFLHQFRGKRYSLQSLSQFALGRIELVVLPLAFFAIDQLIYPSQGIMTGVNDITLGSSSLALTLSYLQIGFWEVLTRSLSLPFSQVSIFILILLAGLALAWRLNYLETIPKVKSGTLLAVGLFLLLAGMFPYVMNGREPTITGWGSRHTMLMGLPIGVCLVALAGNLRQIRWQLKPLVLSFLVAVFMANTLMTYLDWQARWVKDLSVVENLPAVLESGSKRDIEVIYVLDDYLLGSEDRYRSYEWYGLFYLADPENPRLGIDARHYTLEEVLRTSEHFPDFNNVFYSGVDFYGCQGVMTIEKAHSFSEAQMVFRYFAYKLFRSERLPNFLRSLTNLDLERTAWDEASVCPSLY